MTFQQNAVGALKIADEMKESCLKAVFKCERKLIFFWKQESSFGLKFDRVRGSDPRELPFSFTFLPPLSLSLSLSLSIQLPTSWIWYLRMMWSEVILIENTFWLKLEDQLSLNWIRNISLIWWAFYKGLFFIHCFELWKILPWFPHPT